MCLLISYSSNAVFPFYVIHEVFDGIEKMDNDYVMAKEMILVVLSDLLHLLSR